MSLDALTGLIPVAIGAGIVMKVTERSLGSTSPPKKRRKTVKTGSMGYGGLKRQVSRKKASARKGFGNQSKPRGLGDPLRGYGPRNIGKKGSSLTAAQKRYANLS